jgi:hypothetical protein
VIVRTTPVTAAALVAAALSLMLTDAPAATAGVRILSPADEAVLPAGPVPVRLAVRDVRGLRVSVDDDEVTGRLRGAGRRRTAVLRGARVRPGAHWLAVRWRTAEERRPHLLTRRFMVARRHRQLAARLAPRAAVHSTSGIAKLRLRVRRGVGLVRAWVNGRRVRVPHVGRLWPATTLRLGARHRLRFGRNRVRVLVHDFRRARYDVERWTVKVRRTRPLAGGISVYRAKAGGRAVRLDGRGARPTRPGRRLSWRWRVVRRPRGSRARLVGASSTKPRLRADVRGRYVLVQRVSERRRGARASATGATPQRVAVVADTNAPPLGASLEVNITQSDPDAAITIDDAPTAALAPEDCGATPGTGARRCVYPIDQPFGATYLLVLDAVTLEPKAPMTKITGCATDDALRGAISPWGGKNVIAILTSGTSCGGAATSSLIDISNPYTYVFSPTTKPDLGIRSGWYSEAPTFDEGPAEISGYFQKSWPVGNNQASDQYQFVPGNYVAYDTSEVGAPAGQNTMVVGEHEYTSLLPAGSTDGFQVLVLDKLLKPMLGTPATFANGTPIGDMANLLQRARTTPGVSTVLVQSIGRPSPYNVSANDAWNSAAAQLEQLGGNTDVFLSLRGSDWQRPEGTSGWYSFVASPDPSCAPNASLPCESAIEASTPLTERDGDISGVLARNQRWQYAPLLDEAGGDEHTGELLTLAYRPPSKWPFSGDPEARRVLDWLTKYNRGATNLTSLGNGDCYDPGKLRDVRSSYCSMELDWALYAGRLGDSSTGGVCANYPAGELVGVDEDKYKQVCDRVSREIGQLADVKGDMEQLRALIADGAGSALTAYLAVQDMTGKVMAAVEAGNEPKHNVTADAFEIAATGLELISVFIPETEAFEGVLKGAEFLAPTLSLTGEITSLVEGDEQGEAAVQAPATLDAGKLATEMDNRLKAAGAAFDHAWDMLISDPEKLNTAHENFTLDPTNPNNDPECKQPGKTCGIWRGMARELRAQASQAAMQNGVRHWAAGKFMAATYDVWMADTSHRWAPGDVGPSTVHTIGCDYSPVSYVPYVVDHWQTWAPFYGVPQEAAYYLLDKVGLTYGDGSPRYASSVVVLAQGDVSAPASKDFWGAYQNLPPRYWPPASLLNDLYAPPATGEVGGGYGWERPWLYSRGQRFVWHGPGWMLEPWSTSPWVRCVWFAPDRKPG